MTWQDPYGQGPQDVPGSGWQGPGGQPGWQGPGEPGWPQDHPEFQDPYAQQGWQDPYGQYGSPYGPGGSMPPAPTGPSIAALICNIVAALVCCVGIGWLPGIIFAAMALSRANRDPLSAKKLTTWSWMCLAISVVLAVIVIVVFVLIGHSQSSDSTS